MWLSWHKTWHKCFELFSLFIILNLYKKHVSNEKKNDWHSKNYCLIDAYFLHIPLLSTNHVCFAHGQITKQQKKWLNDFFDSVCMDI